MKDTLRFTGKILLIAFLLWHMFAVAVYAVPRESRSGVATIAKGALIPLVTPYLYITSQWQLWNLFAPDPLRRVTFYRFEVRENGTWRELQTVRNGTYSVWRHAVRFKMLQNGLDEFAGGRAEFAARIMHLMCGEYALDSGTPIRLRYEYYVIPKHTERQSVAWWNSWTPSPQITPGFTTTCP